MRPSVFEYSSLWNASAPTHPVKYPGSVLLTMKKDSDYDKTAAAAYWQLRSQVSCIFSPKLFH